MKLFCLWLINKFSDFPTSVSNLTQELNCTLYNVQSMPVMYAACSVTSYSFPPTCLWTCTMYIYYYTFVHILCSPYGSLLTLWSKPEIQAVLTFLKSLCLFQTATLSILALRSLSLLLSFSLRSFPCLPSFESLFLVISSQIPIAPLVPLSFSDNFTPYWYNFCSTLPSFWHSHSLFSVHILFNFCWSVLLVAWTKICGRNHLRIHIFPYRNKVEKANFTSFLLFFWGILASKGLADFFAYSLQIYYFT